MRLNIPNESSIFVRRFGHGQPVLVLSGLGMHSWQWLPYLLPFARRYQFIIPDWRGFGGSQHCQVTPQDAISQHWQDLQQLCVQQQLHDVKVIAYSMGASIAMYGMQYADFSHKINAYLHIDQSPCIRNQIDWPYGLYAAQQPVFLQHLQNLSDDLKDYSHLSQMPDHEQQQLFQDWQALFAFQGMQPWLLQSFKYVSHFNTLKKFALPLQNLQLIQWYLDAYLQHDLDLRPSLSTLNCPMTWLSGAHSNLYPLKGQQILAEALGAQHIIFPQSGHAPLLREPKRFYQSLAKFLP